MSDAQLTARLDLPPHQRGCLPLPSRPSSAATGLQTELRIRQRLNLRYNPSLTKATRLHDLEGKEDEDEDLNDVSSAYSLATHRSRQQSFLSNEDTECGPGRIFQRRPTYTEVATLFLDLGESVAFLNPNKAGEMVVIAGEEIRDVQYAGSYKWVESADKPTLAVPAVPDVWDPPESIGRLQHDRDIADYREFPDYAAALLPPNLSTMEPTFLALESPDILRTVDLVTGRNSLRKLWSIFKQDTRGTRPFRIDVTHIAGLVVFERYEPVDKQDARPPSGYHLAYHEAATRKVLIGSDRTPGCIRIVKYKFGGLDMIVKFDVSAYLLVDDEPMPSEEDLQSGLGRIGEEDLAVSMDGLDFDDPVHNGQSIEIHRTSLTPPDQNQLVSISTKTHLDECDTEHYFPQLYFAQVPRLHYARHVRGDFDKSELRVYGLLDEYFVKREQRVIDKMAALLRWIVDLATQQPDGEVLGLVWDGVQISVTRREDGPELSAPVVDMIRDVRD